MQEGRYRPRAVLRELEWLAQKAAARLNSSRDPKPLCQRATSGPSYNVVKLH